MIAIVMVGMIAALLAYVVVDGLIHQRRFNQHVFSVMQGQQLSSRPGKRWYIDCRNGYQMAYGITLHRDNNWSLWLHWGNRGITISRH